MRTHVCSLMMVAMAACTSTPTKTASVTGQIQLGFLTSGEQADGVAIDPTTGHPWYLVPGRGLVESDATTGALISEIDFGAHGLDIAPGNPGTSSSDLAFRSDGRMVVSTSSEGYLYDPVQQTTTPYFCLVQAPTGEQNQNNALTIDEQGNRIFAAPVTYQVEGSQMVADRLVFYAESSGTASGDANMAGGFIAQGLFWDAATQELLAVTEGTLARVGVDGSITDKTELEGVTQAQGVYADSNGVHVLDGAAGTITTFTRPTFDGLPVE